MVTIVTMVAILGIALPTAAQAPQGLPGPIAPPHFLPTEDRAWAAGETWAWSSSGTTRFSGLSGFPKDMELLDRKEEKPVSTAGLWTTPWSSRLAAR